MTTLTLENGFFMPGRSSRKFWFGQVLALGGLALSALVASAVDVVNLSAPAWTLIDMNGTVRRSTDFSCKVVLITFFTVDCVPCQRETPDFSALQTQYGSTGLVVIGFAEAATAAQAQQYAATYGANYIICPVNPFNPVEYDLLTTFGYYPDAPKPYSVIIDRTNRIAHCYKFYHTKPFHEGLIVPLLNDQPPSCSPSPPPGLAYRREGGKIVLSWSTNASNFVLETRNATSPTATWMATGQAPVVSNGVQSVTLAIRNGGRTFRLRRIGT